MTKKDCSSLIEDGAPLYCAITMRQWQTKYGVNLFGGWSGNNPNLNPIELLWSQMKQLKNNSATSALGLKKNCSKNLGKILLIYIKSLFKSILRRRKVVVTAFRGHT